MNAPCVWVSIVCTLVTCGTMIYLGRRIVRFWEDEQRQFLSDVEDLHLTEDQLANKYGKDTPR